MTMACALPFSKLVSANSLKANSDRHCLTQTFYPRRVARLTSVSTNQSRSLAASVAKSGIVADPKASPPMKGDGKISRNESPPAVAFSSGFGLNLPSFPSAWNMWLIGAAMLVTVPVYRRMKRVEEMKKTAETAKEVMDKVANEAEEIDADAANMTDEGSISEIAFKLEYISEKIGKITQKAEEVLKKVEHIKEEVKELVDTKIKQGEAEE